MPPGAFNSCSFSFTPFVKVCWCQIMNVRHIKSKNKVESIFGVKIVPLFIQESMKNEQKATKFYHILDVLYLQRGIFALSA